MIMGSEAQLDLPNFDRDETSITQSITEAAESAYKSPLLAGIIEQKDWHQDDVPFQHICTQTAISLSHELSKIGFYTQMVGVGGGYGFSHHNFVYVEMQNYRAFVDPTWKQFIKKDDINIYGQPNALIITIQQEGPVIPGHIPDLLKEVYLDAWKNMNISIHEDSD